MRQFDSWQSYWIFERAVKKEFRYFRNEFIEKFLQTVLETSEKRKKKLPEKSYLWRAQLGHEWYQDIPAPYRPERMVPLVNEASEGRVNPKGISYLYTATTKETAMAEVRPWLGSLISVGQFETNREMILIDCSLYHDRTVIYLQEPDPEKREEAVWSHIDQAFSQPVTNNDKMADYIPTQIIAELFKCNGYDGIVYKSMLGKGYNIVLFDVASANLVNCFLFEVNRLSFSFKEAANPYFVKKKENNWNPYK